MENATRLCDCGGELELRPIDHVWVKRRGRSYFAPKDLHVMTCVKCRNYIISDEIFDQVDARVRTQIAAQEASEIESLLNQLDRLKVGRKEAAALLGVHYTYLSKVARGRRVAGESLTNLLEILVAVPEALAYARGDARGRSRDHKVAFTLWHGDTSANDNALAAVEAISRPPRPRKKSYELPKAGPVLGTEDVYKVCGA